MFKTILLASTLLLTAVGANAYERTPSDSTPACGDSRQIIMILTQRFGEVPVQNDETTKKVVAVNATAGTWTLLQFKNPQELCVLAHGTGWKPGDDILKDIDESVEPEPEGDPA